jgi:EF hand
MFTTSLTARTMSFTRATFAAAVVAVMTAIPNARASDVSQDKMPASYGALMKMKPMEVMHLMDPDRKGYAAKSDFMKFHEEMFEKMDRNHDGNLSEEEFVARIHSAP